MDSRGYPYDDLDYDQKYRDWLSTQDEDAAPFPAANRPDPRTWETAAPPIDVIDFYHDPERDATIGPLCEGEDERGYCGHASCATIENEWVTGAPAHDCPYENFLNDPITIAYGVGSEMVHLMSCAVCDAEQNYLD